MRAAVYHGAGDIRISEVPAPDPGPGRLLLEVATVGICGTDAHEYRSGPHMFPAGGFIPGHEFSGRVVAFGDGVEGFSEGDLVSSGAGISCGSCHWCRQGRTNLCVTYSSVGLQHPGALAEYVVVPAGVCLEVASLGLSPDVAALAQPMSIAVHSAKRGRAQPDEVALVIGAGGIGAFLIHALVRLGVRTSVVDLDRERLLIATSLGAEVVAHPDTIPDTGPLSVVYEVTGTQQGLQLAMSAAAPGTRVVLVGLQDGPASIEPRQISLREIELIGTNAHVFASDFSEAAHLLASREQGWSDIAPVAIPLDDLVEKGLTPMIEGRVTAIKTLIDPQASEARPTR